MKKTQIVFHLIDEFSRLSAACFIPNKAPVSVLRAILDEWMSNYGTCERMLHDRGGEFDEDDLRDLMGSLGVRISTTAPFSPFSNGVVERHSSEHNVIKNERRFGLQVIGRPNTAGPSSICEKHTVEQTWVLLIPTCVSEA